MLGTAEIKQRHDAQPDSGHRRGLWAQEGCGGDVELSAVMAESLSSLVGWVCSL